MQKPVYLFVICTMLVGGLAACSLPGATTIAPTAATGQSIVTQAALSSAETVLPSEKAVPPATKTTLPPVQTALPATKTTFPPTQTSLPPTETHAPGPAQTLDQIQMLNANDGWGWASKAGNITQLLRTADGGQTWLDVSPQGEYVYYGSFFLNSQAAWLPFYNSASNAGGLLHTTDGGQTWGSLPQTDILQNAWIEFTSLTEGLAETTGVGAGNAYLNYYQTIDGGATWKPILLTAPTPEPGLAAGTIHLCNICGDSLYYDAARVIITYGDMASDPVGVARLSISTDLGKHWKALRLPLPDQKYAEGSVAPQSPTFFGAQGLMPVNIIKYNQDGSLGFSVLVMYTTQDGGQSWQAAPATLENERAQIDTVQILSAKDAFVRCGRNLCSTSDGAQTWRHLPDSLNFDQSAAASDYVSQFNFIDPSIGWAISGESGATNLWKSTDGGATWTKLSPTLAK